jgi:hypothetical protein
VCSLTDSLNELICEVESRDYSKDAAFTAVDRLTSVLIEYQKRQTFTPIQ